ncbi:hypothetical protein [Methylococcus mesophilus]|nr:hypothetical protein [Methylococcus mesophilus]UZR27507.1 hypothetical protein OOT43_12260 [Methylococcus mesophilus]
MIGPALVLCAAPYLTLVMSRDIEIRADRPGSEVRMYWQGHPCILARP